MELRHLRTFVTVAEELHFGRAAARLQFTQSSVSQQVQALERELGVRLLFRNTRQVQLTDAGRAFLGPATGVLEAARIATRAAHLPPDEAVGTVSIGFAGACASHALPRLTRAVAQRLPGVELDLRGPIYSGAASALVERGELDIGFSRLPVIEPHINWRVYERESVVLALPTDHRLAALETVPLDELAGEGFVTYPSTGGVRIREALMRICEEHGFRPRVAQEAPDAYSILSLVAAGVGISLVEASVQAIGFPGVVHRNVQPTPEPIPAILTWHRETASHATRAVLAIAEEVLPAPASPA